MLYICKDMKGFCLNLLCGKLLCVCVCVRVNGNAKRIHSPHEQEEDEETVAQCECSVKCGTNTEDEVCVVYTWGEDTIKNTRGGEMGRERKKEERKEGGNKNG